MKYMTQFKFRLGRTVSHYRVCMSGTVFAAPQPPSSPLSPTSHVLTPHPAGQPEHHDFTVNKKTSWTAKANVAWLTVSSTSGISPGSVNVTASQQYQQYFTHRHRDHRHTDIHRRPKRCRTATRVIGVTGNWRLGA